MVEEHFFNFFESNKLEGTFNYKVLKVKIKIVFKNEPLWDLVYTLWN